MKSETLQIGLYRIDTDIELFSGKDHFHTVLKKKLLEYDPNFEEQAVKTSLPNSFSYSLLYKKDTRTPKWKKFLGSVAKPESRALEKNKTRVETFVLLIYGKSSKELYAVTGGLGHFALQDLIDDEFGIDILSRLIKKEDKILKALREKSVMGGILGATKYFRTSNNLFENDSFGKIYQELIATLDKDILINHFGFGDSDLKKDLVCVAKSSFKIKKAITFSELMKVVQGCEFVLSNLAPMSVNSVKKLGRKKDQILIAQLRDELLGQLWTRFNKLDEGFDFDICHRDYERFLTADSFVVRKGLSKDNYLGDVQITNLVNVDQIFGKMRNLGISFDSKEQFGKEIAELKIISHDEEGLEGTTGTIYAHLFGDVVLDDRRYFFIDNNWYLIENEFITELNSSCAHFIKANVNHGLDKTWDVSLHDEDDYNSSYINAPNTIVLHRVKPENIELCDILKWNDVNVFLYHIKQGFDNKMRDLCSQVATSANRLRNDLGSTREYLEKVYNQLRNLATNTPYSAQIQAQTNSYSKEQFLDIFKDKSPIFVVGVLDITTLTRKIEDVHMFRSNIAKFSLQELCERISGYGMGLQITQIQKP